MKVLVFPADKYGCGYYRLIWPAQMLKAQGHDIEVIWPEDRGVSLTIKNNVVQDVSFPEADVIVLQRVTHRYLVQAIPMIRKKGVAVIVDLDDDLRTIHPSNPSWWALHPRNFDKVDNQGKLHMHSWRFLNEACKEATWITTSTPLLAEKYASHGRGSVFWNYLPDHFYSEEIQWENSDLIGWPASLHSHPDDATAVGNAISRVVSQGYGFGSFGDKKETDKAFGFPKETAIQWPAADIYDWPKAIAHIGVGIAPLSDTIFNHSKSWLKPLEMSAVGIPWVGSPRKEYERLAEYGCGILAEKPKAWFKYLKQLTKDENLRIEMSQAGKSVAAQLKLRDHAWELLEVWEHALKIQRS